MQTPELPTPPTWLARCVGHARAMEAAALHYFEALDASLAQLDDAISAHLAHGAMAGADPLTDSLYSQLEGPAAEGAQAPLPYASGCSAGRSARQRLAAAGRDPGLYWAMAAAAMAAVVVSIAYPLGFAT